MKLTADAPLYLMVPSLLSDRIRAFAPSLYSYEA